MTNTDTDILAGFRFQFTEEVDGRTVVFGPAPRPFPRDCRGVIGTTIHHHRKAYVVLGIKRRDGPVDIAKGEMIGLVVRELPGAE